MNGCEEKEEEEVEEEAEMSLAFEKLKYKAHLNGLSQSPLYRIAPTSMIVIVPQVLEIAKRRCTPRAHMPTPFNGNPLPTHLPPSSSLSSLFPSRHTFSPSSPQRMKKMLAW
ncbi:hypothetical protein BHE74_00025355 [Ensete ventricosum]|nr:hypothetical protein GW17_00051377 [Ensete ventricosum]RWW67217.1 hypothetical protein BHE74_00025355 [Ensete ventricosum]RZR79543.1 hypothetical protein BHM03_00005285 [Ensete ventricosum]